jgi:mannose-6-phosphate isomerase-like protein (cupin superfamily)
MATARVPWMLVAMVIGLSLVGGPVWAAEGEVFDVQEQVKKGDQRTGFTLQELVKTSNYTVGAVAIQEEIKMHRHADGDHNLYILSGQGTVTLGDRQIPIKPGMLINIPKGLPHEIRAQGGEVTLLDFAQPPFDPQKMEWVK